MQIWTESINHFFTIICPQYHQFLKCLLLEIKQIHYITGDRNSYLKVFFKIYALDKGPIKQHLSALPSVILSFCPSVCPSVFLELCHYFFQSFGMVVESMWICEWQSWIFQENVWPKMDQKQGFINLLENLVINFY